MNPVLVQKNEPLGGNMFIHSVCKSWVAGCLLASALHSSHSAQASSSYFDVAIEPTTGDNLILQINDNHRAEILVVNDFNPEIKQSIELTQFESSAGSFEIEMSRSDLLSYLVLHNGMWQLKSLKNRAGRWEKASHFSGLSGEGTAEHLTALPDGRLALTVKRTTESEAQVLLIEPSQEGSSYTVIESIPEAKIPESAAELIKVEDSPHYSSGPSLGFTVGGTSSVGVAYRRHFENQWGVQVGGIAFGDSNSLFASLGSMLMRTISKTQWTRFYALAGVSAFYRGAQAVAPIEPSCANPSDKTTCNIPSTPGTIWTNSTLLNFGVGVGMEFLLRENLGLALELPLTLMLDVNSDAVKFSGVYPIPNASLLYYF